MYWQTTRYRIDLTTPKVVGIVNITPDSFFDGGLHAGPQQAIAHAEQLVKEGADVVDLGGESTRPGAAPLPADQELGRVLPVLRAVLSLGVPVSVDTRQPEVMRAVLDEGADIINDVNALRHPQALPVVAAHSSCGVCLMHMQGEPASMQHQPAYVDVVAEVSDFLQAQAQRVGQAGVARERIVLDPGIGFGKRVEHNLALLAHQRQLTSLGYPLLLGWSRKSTLGALTGRAAPERLAASVAAALAAMHLGAKLVRVHDVAATIDALQVWRAAGLI